jgi:hypothetical protein
MGFQTNYTHEPSGVEIPGSYHKIIRLTLDPVNKIAIILVAAYKNKEARDDINRLSFAQTEYRCENRWIGPPVPPDPSITVDPIMTTDYDEYFGDLDGKNAFGQAYLYLKEKETTYKDAVEA